MRTRPRTRQRAATWRRRASLSTALGATAALVVGGALAVSATADDATPPPGLYQGTAVQIIGADNELEEPFVFDLTFEIDDDGMLTSFDTEYWWVCATVGQHGFSPFEPAVGIPITADVPFATATDVDHLVEGTISADGAASGLGMANVGICGNSIFTWTAEIEGWTPPAPEPEPEPGYELTELAPISEWEIARTGLPIQASGFERDEAVTITIAGETLEETADFFGDVELMLGLEVAAGDYTVTLSTDAGSVSRDVTVVADDEYFDAHTETPLPLVLPEVLTVSESGAAPVEVIVRNHAADAAIDVYLDGERLDTVHTSWAASVEYVFDGPFSPGEHVVELVHPSVTVETSFVVVDDGQDTPAPAGTYTGVATQTVAGTTWTGEDRQFPLTFTVDDAGRISDLETEYQWVCWLGTPPTGELDVTGLPAAPITADRPFGIHWIDGVDEHSFYGTVQADGSASGSLVIDDGSCGFSRLTWTAQGDVTGQPDPDPKPTPTPDPEPTPEPTPDPEPTPTPEPTPDPEPTPTPTPDPDPTPDPEPTPEPTPDPEPEPETIPVVAPTADDLTAETEGGISTPTKAEPAETVTVMVLGAAPGSEVGLWLFSDPEYLGTRTVSADSTVEVVIPADAELGEHQVAAWSADGLIGWTSITVVAPDSGDDTGDEDADAGDDDGAGGSDGSTDGSDSGTGDGAGTGDESGASDNTDGQPLPATGVATVFWSLLGAVLLLALGAPLTLMAHHRATK